MNEARPLRTARAMASYLGVSPGALLRWARDDEVPSIKLPSGAVRFDPEAMDAWLGDCSRGVDSEGGAADRGVTNALADRAADGLGPSDFSSSNARPPIAADSTEEEDHAT